MRQWAEKHDGEFPNSDRAQTGIAESFWSLPELSGTSYQYVAGATLHDAQRIIAYEPEFAGDEALAVTVQGELLKLPFEDLLAKVRK